MEEGASRPARYPVLFGAIAVAALLSALASASSPFFLSSAGASTLADQLRDATRFGAGASVEFEDVPSRLEPGLPGAARRIQVARERLRGALDGVPHVGRPVFTILGATTGRLNASPETFLQVRLLVRTGALQIRIFRERAPNLTPTGTSASACHPG